MKDTAFIEKLKLAAEKPSAYLWGTFGMQLTDRLIDQKANQYPARYSSERQAQLRHRAESLCWAWDCAGLIKGILWGWTGEETASYGGGIYQSNGVPDTNVSGLEECCTDLSEDFSALRPGELLFLPGHVGVYAGDGKVIEATLWKEYDGVVQTDLSARGWTHHGKLSFIEYTAEPTEPTPKLFLHVEKIGLYLRDGLAFNQKSKASGKILAFCPPGGDMEVTELIPGLQPDGYQWVKTRYKDKEGVSQYDSTCYYLYRK